jgi:hypothetical protein
VAHLLKRRKPRANPGQDVRRRCKPLHTRVQDLALIHTSKRPLSRKTRVMHEKPTRRGGWSDCCVYLTAYLSRPLPATRNLMTPSPLMTLLFFCAIAAFTVFTSLSAE